MGGGDRGNVGGVGGKDMGVHSPGLSEQRVKFHFHFCSSEYSVLIIFFLKSYKLSYGVFGLSVQLHAKQEIL